jgi:hypothetical protein
MTRISKDQWDSFIESFRDDLERVDDLWKDAERPYRNLDGDVINAKRYCELNVWRVENIVHFVLEWEKCAFFSEGYSSKNFAKRLIDDVYEWSDTAELCPLEYYQTDDHLKLLSMLIVELNEDEPEVDGIRPIVIQRFNEFFHHHAA